LWFAAAGFLPAVPLQKEKYFSPPCFFEKQTVGEIPTAQKPF
jgi:hypothetical protein